MPIADQPPGRRGRRRTRRRTRASSATVRRPATRAPTTRAEAEAGERRCGARCARTRRPAPSRRSTTISRVRWGRIVVVTDWNSCSGARAISSALKTSAACLSASPGAVSVTISTPRLRIACSEHMITSTAPVKPTPWRHRELRLGDGLGLVAVLRHRRTWCRSAQGTTQRLTSGADGDRQRERVAPVQHPDRGQDADQRSARPTPSSRGRRRGRSGAGRPASRARSSWRRRR